jgi:hypothetical protein
MPLANPRPWNPEWSEALRRESAHSLFAGSYSTEGAFAGLLLYLGEWDRAHEFAQALHTPEGSYWHAIVHRQEPDSWNSNYWFRHTGTHAIFPALAKAARAVAVEQPEAAFPDLPDWRPGVFVEYCETARKRPGSAAEALAIEIQHIEWKMLFDYCQRL